MSANADDPLILAATHICDGEPVDWRRIRELLTNPSQETIADELASLEQFARASASELAVSWGRFTLVDVIGGGQFGTVYRALDPTLQIPVALKIIRPRAGGAFNSERALQEARSLAKISHQSVVRVFGAERIGNDVGVSMELVEGRTLDAIVRERGPLSASEAVVIGLELCRALAAVHGAGLLHGDIKAHNVMRADGGRTVLMDFGAGRELSMVPAAPGGDFAGTPIYLAPEVFAGANRTPTSDIYSLGVLLYFLVTGAYPVDGDTRTEMGRLHVQGTARRPLRDARPDLPDGFIRTVERALAEDPRQRFATAGALESALTSTLASQPVPAPGPGPRWWQLGAIAAAVVIVAGIAAFAASRGWIFGGTRSRDTSASASVTAIPTPAPVAPAAAEYRIDAAFYRERGRSEQRLEPDARVAKDDSLFLRVQLSEPAYLYVVNEDEKGESYLLFPVPGLTLSNPLPAGQAHRLPGQDRRGQEISWKVSSAGGREHFLLVARRERSPEFEKIISTLPPPVLDRAPEPQRLSPDAVTTLRSVGGLAVSSISPAGTSLLLHQQPQYSTRFTPGEETVRGPWIRHAVFDNPRRSPSDASQRQK